MGYILLWVESIAAILLLLAATMSGAAREQPTWARRLLAFVPSLGVLTTAALVAWLAWFIDAVLLFPHPMVEATIAWSLTITGGVVALWWAGCRRQGDPAVLRAATWPRRKLALAGAVAFGLFLATFWNMDNATKTQLASLRAEAGTIVLGAAPVRVPDHENAALLYQQAIEALAGCAPLPEPWQTRAFGPSAARTPLDWSDPVVTNYLQQRGPGLELLRRAAERPSCQFERQYGRFDTLLPEVQEFRQGAHDLALQARFRASQGDTAAALTNVAAILKMAHHVSSEPFVIAVLVGVAVEGTGLQTLSQVLEHSTPAARDFAAFKGLQPVSYRTAMQRALQMEQALGLSAFVMVAEGDFRTFTSLEGSSTPNQAEEAMMAVLGPFWRLVQLPTDLNNYRERMNQLSGLLGQPYFAAVKRMEALNDQWHHDRGGIVTSLLTPALLKSVTAAARGDALRRLTLLGAAAAEYRAVQGKYPARLDALVPKYTPLVPIDPFSGQALKMLARDSGVLLYSIGPDLTDDGGQEIKTKDGRQLGDIVFRLGPTPPAAEGPMPPAP